MSRASRPNSAFESRPSFSQQQMRQAVQQQRQDQGFGQAGGLAGQIRANHPDANNWFGNSFFNQHGYTPAYARAGLNLWSAARWSSVAGWMPWGWDDSSYYDDSGSPMDTPQSSNDSSNSVTYSLDDNQQFGGSQPISGGTPQGNWLPLGVFVLGQSQGLAANSNMFIQLALDKQGNIAGTYYNATTDKTYQLQGSVDAQSQQATWQAANNPNSPVMSTALYNLTQNSAPVQLQFPDNSDQTWELVRLNQQ